VEKGELIDATGSLTNQNKGKSRNKKNPSQESRKAKGERINDTL